MNEEHAMRYPANGKNKDSIEGRTRKTKESNERSVRTKSGRSGGDSGSSNTVECGGLDGAYNSRSYGRDGGPGGYDSSWERVGLLKVEDEVGQSR